MIRCFGAMRRVPEPDVAIQPVPNGVTYVGPLEPVVTGPLYQESGMLTPSRGSTVLQPACTGNLPSSGEPHMRGSPSSSRTACRLLSDDDQPSMERSHTL
jgi:hypothetical protein